MHKPPFSQIYKNTERVFFSGLTTQTTQRTELRKPDTCSFEKCNDDRILLALLPFIHHLYFLSSSPHKFTDIAVALS